MTKDDRSVWDCDFNSGSHLRIGRNTRHVVLRIREGMAMGHTSAAIGIMPETMRAIGMQLLALADEYEADAAREGGE